MSAPLHITLIGFSGTGKTTVAGLVAQRLGWQAADSDDLVEASSGRSVAQIFAEEGEAAFRRREVAVLAELAGRPKLVVAAGGGATLLTEARSAIASAGLVVCLEATPETINARLNGKSETSERPLLNTSNPLVRIRQLKSQRAALYDLADFTVHTDALSVSEVADEIVRFYQTRGEQVFARPGRLQSLQEAPVSLPSVSDAPGATTIVRTTSADYPAYVSWGALERLGEYTRRAAGRARRALVISDANVMRLWGEAASGSLRNAGFETASFLLTPGDASKNLNNAAQIYEWLAQQRAERRDVVIALGGGMVNDLAGFVAATYMRGMPVIQVPTSLLAMVDASIGGKTAVNQSGAKNLVGVFYQPSAVVADVATLATLPRRELVEGMGEVIKHALIRDPGLLDLLEERLEDILSLEPELTTRVIARNVQIKAAVVSEDERETGGVREILNYGHTLGHAFESAADYELLLHGEAVAVGMAAAAAIGQRLGVTPAALVHRQNRLIERAGLPLRPPPGLSKDRIRGALALDKKVVAGGQRWVLLKEAGQPITSADVPLDIVEEIIDSLL